MADNLSSFEVYKDGEKVGTIKADDARKVGPIAVKRWGAGTYEVKLEAARDHHRSACCGADVRFMGCFCNETYSRAENEYVSRCIGSGGGHD
ncbi:hypothetical protein IEQ11_07235 [Lysobacter capsici]|uniref:hypothetical protein n=1 Tax=Lysobacter capsici TaxID=435897 RepID=UPI00177AC2D7|nr:hypothetical protein [Lysobacter capsici]UOF16435.1 hypothetical protein IEQ11_07235 [Lysobacter capsici]